MTPNDFLKVIQNEVGLPDEIPKGWYSSSDLEKKWSVQRTEVLRRIKIGKKFGYVTQRKFLIRGKNLRRVPYYNFHEKENSQKNNKWKNMENPIRLRRKD
jgi:hypothetical protein